MSPTAHSLQTTASNVKSGQSGSRVPPSKQPLQSVAGHHWRCQQRSRAATVQANRAGMRSAQVPAGMQAHHAGIEGGEEAEGSHCERNDGWQRLILDEQRRQVEHRAVTCGRGGKGREGWHKISMRIGRESEEGRAAAQEEAAEARGGSGRGTAIGRQQAAAAH